MKEYTVRKNINRGYMKLDVWQLAMQLYKLVWQIVKDLKIDFKLRAQIIDAAQSVSSNIAEGYSRRSINEYIQHLYIALGSLSETLTRIIGLKETNQITDEQFERIDILHYEVENKLIRLIESLEKKKNDGTWINRISEEFTEYTSNEFSAGEKK
ncbi:MAG: four helix bundle protein [Bacteroidota bacterium]